MPSERELTKLRQNLAHRVLAVILVDPGAVPVVLDVLGRNRHNFPEPEARAWLAVLQCSDMGVPPTVPAVAARCDVDAGFLQAIANQWTDEDSRAVQYHAQELRRLGTLTELRTICREGMRDYTDPEQIQAYLDFQATRLEELAISALQRDGGAAEVAVSAWDSVEAMQGQGIPWGLDWLDRLTGGAWPGFNYWIAGAYKQRKTTLMRNCVLTACQAGHAVDVFCAEGSREMFALDCQAMIATRLLCEQGTPPIKLRLSGDFLRRVWRHQLAVLTREELDAVNAARAEWDGYNLRVWDTRDGIRDLATLRYRIRHSRFMYGTAMVWADYSQLFGPSAGTIFERQSRVSLSVQEIAAELQVAFCMLTQRNQASIMASGGYSVGVKGGGDAEAAADAVLVPSYNADETPTVLSVSLHHSRHTGTGSDKHTINPSSGLILDRWFDKENRRL